MASTHKEGGAIRLTVRYSLVACLGFVIDVTLLKLGVHLGLTPAVARAISLLAAMQTTFLVNGLLVFRCLNTQGLFAQWTGYMTTNAFGNLCNYLAFTTLISLHRPVLSDHLFAVSVGGLIAWTINYSCTSLVFGGFSKLHAYHRRRCAERSAADAPAAPATLSPLPAPAPDTRRKDRCIAA